MSFNSFFCDLEYYYVCLILLRIKLLNIVSNTLATECVNSSSTWVGTQAAIEKPTKNKDARRFNSFSKLWIGFCLFGCLCVLLFLEWNDVVCNAVLPFFSLALRVFAGIPFANMSNCFSQPTCLFSWLTWLAGILLVCLHYLLMANNKRRKQTTHIKYSCDTGAEAPYEKNIIYLKNYTQNAQNTQTHFYIIWTTIRKIINQKWRK